MFDWVQTAFFSTEMTAREIQSRFIANQSKVSQWRLEKWFDDALDKVLFSLNTSKGDVFLRKKIARDYDYMYVGFRYGYSSMSQNANFSINDDENSIKC